MDTDVVIARWLHYICGVLMLVGGLLLMRDTTFGYVLLMFGLALLAGSHVGEKEPPPSALVNCPYCRELTWVNKVPVRVRYEGTCSKCRRLIMETPAQDGQ